MGIRVSELAGGLRVVTERMPEVRSVASGFWVGTGSRDEPADESGASHFLEHLLFKGTERLSARDISEVVDSVGGDMNAFTTKEYTAFYVRALADSTDQGVDLLSDILWRPALRAEEVELERQVILEEILMHEDEPADLVHDVWARAAFPDHGLGRETLGDEESVKALTRERIAAFWAQHYRPANVVFAAAGLLDHEEIVAAVESRLGPGGGGEAPVRAPVLAPPRPVLVCEQDSEQVHVVVGVRAVDRDSPDRYPLSVLDHVLGGGLSSRLWQSVREERGLAYSVYSFRNGYQGTGALGVYAGTAPEHLAEVLGLVMEEIRSLAAAGVSERELEVARGRLVGELCLSLEDSTARMNRIGRCLLVHGEVPTVDEVAARIRSVTRDDVARVASQLLSGEPIVAAVGPVTARDLAAA